MYNFFSVRGGTFFKNFYGDSYGGRAPGRCRDAYGGEQLIRTCTMYHVSHHTIHAVPNNTAGYMQYESRAAAVMHTAANKYYVQARSHDIAGTGCTYQITRYMHYVSYRNCSTGLVRGNFHLPILRRHRRQSCQYIRCREKFIFLTQSTIRSYLIRLTYPCSQCPWVRSVLSKFLRETLLS